MDKVTGIGGVFIKAKDPKALAKWYQENLGVEFGENSYITFQWTNEHNPSVPGNTVFSFFKEDSDYFNPSESKFMLNFRVKNLHLLLFELFYSIADGGMGDHFNPTVASGRCGSLSAHPAALAVASMRPRRYDLRMTATRGARWKS